MQVSIAQWTEVWVLIMGLPQVFSAQSLENSTFLEVQRAKGWGVIDVQNELEKDRREFTGVLYDSGLKGKGQTDENFENVSRSRYNGLLIE